MDIDTAVKGYFDTRERLQKSWSSPLKLGDVGLKMATYGSYIGDHLGELKEKYEQDRAHIYLLTVKEKSATFAENQARSETAELRGQIARIELVHKNLWSLVSIIQSQLKTLNSESNNNF